MAQPEVLPIRTSERFLYELRPSDQGYEWTAVRTLGTRLTAEVSALDYLSLRKVRGISDPTEQSDEALQIARVSIWYQGQRVGGVESVPEVHLYTLVARVIALSTVGADPFVEAPAGSSLSPATKATSSGFHASPATALPTMPADGSQSLA